MPTACHSVLRFGPHAAHGEKDADGAAAPAGVSPSAHGAAPAFGPTLFVFGQTSACGRPQPPPSERPPAAGDGYAGPGGCLPAGHGPRPPDAASEIFRFGAGAPEIFRFGAPPAEGRADGPGPPAGGGGSASGMFVFGGGAGGARGGGAMGRSCERDDGHGHHRDQGGDPSSPDLVLAVGESAAWPVGARALEEVRAQAGLEKLLPHGLVRPRPRGLDGAPGSRRLSLRLRRGPREVHLRLHGEELRDAEAEPHGGVLGRLRRVFHQGHQRPRDERAQRLRERVVEELAADAESELLQVVRGLEVGLPELRPHDLPELPQSHRGGEAQLQRHAHQQLLRPGEQLLLRRAEREGLRCRCRELREDTGRRTQHHQRLPGSSLQSRVQRCQPPRRGALPNARRRSRRRGWRLRRSGRRGSLAGGSRRGGRLRRCALCPCLASRSHWCWVLRMGRHWDSTGIKTRPRGRAETRSGRWGFRVESRCWSGGTRRCCVAALCGLPPGGELMDLIGIGRRHWDGVHRVRLTGGGAHRRFFERGGCSSKAGCLDSIQIGTRYCRCSGFRARSGQLVRRDSHRGRACLKLTINRTTCRIGTRYCRRSGFGARSGQLAQRDSHRGWGCLKSAINNTGCRRRCRHGLRSVHLVQRIACRGGGCSNSIRNKTGDCRLPGNGIRSRRLARGGARRGSL
mmetsp:Transcript_12400/g.39678  ORF Transcript_12400/g.39678 Transcript_12400/m.39678 type:complete len:684 (+) Transcript_12400:54-2105(+)